MRVPIRFPNRLSALSRPLVVVPLIVVLLIAFIAASALGRMVCEARARPSDPLPARTAVSLLKAEVP